MLIRFRKACSSLAGPPLPPSGVWPETHASEAPADHVLAGRGSARLRLVSPPGAAGRAVFDELAARRALYGRRPDSQVTPPGWDA